MKWRLQNVWSRHKRQDAAPGIPLGAAFCFFAEGIGKRECRDFLFAFSQVIFFFANPCLFFFLCLPVQFAFGFRCFEAGCQYCRAIAGTRNPGSIRTGTGIRAGCGICVETGICAEGGIWGLSRYLYLFSMNALHIF